jgi:hypothetical protein
MIRVPTENVDLVKKILKDEYVKVDITNLIIDENLMAETSCHVLLCIDGKPLNEAFYGVGVVDAVFNGLKHVYASEYQSLRSIELIKFQVQAKSIGTNAEVSVEVAIKNSFSAIFDFVDSSRSLTASSARVCAAIVEYFINSEKAYVALYSALEDAQERNREDLITRYTAELAQLVQSTSYTEVIERIQKKL